MSWIDKKWITTAGIVVLATIGVLYAWGVIDAQTSATLGSVVGGLTGVTMTLQLGAAGGAVAGGTVTRSVWDAASGRYVTTTEPLPPQKP